MPSSVRYNALDGANRLIIHAMFRFSEGRGMIEKDSFTYSFLRENAPLHFRAVGKVGLDCPSEFYRSINPISAGEQIFLVFPLDFRSSYGPD